MKDQIKKLIEDADQLIVATDKQLGFYVHDLESVLKLYVTLSAAIIENFNKADAQLLKLTVDYAASKLKKEGTIGKRKVNKIEINGEQIDVEKLPKEVADFLKNI